MKVHLIKAVTVINFAKEHASSLKSFENWIDKVNIADWETVNDVKRTFSTADILGNRSNRIVFDVGGNNHRVVCTYYFNELVDTVTLFVKWIGTHGEYDKLCADNNQYTAENFKNYER